MESTAQSPLRPATIEELSSAVRSAGERNCRLRISGSGSMALTQFPPDSRPIQAVSTLKMNKVIEHAVGDMTVIVQAGISLEALQRQLAWQNQWIPLDPPVFGPGRTPGQRTLGGLIASNSLGPLRFGCGDWRLFILGMRWIDSAGRIIKGGGRTMKNVAGYSTPRLMIGSCGSLGVIAEVTLRTFARPVDEQCVLFYCGSAGEAEAMLGEIMLCPATPAYVQVIGHRTFAANPLQLPAGASAAGMVVVAGFLGRPEICSAQIEILRKLPLAQKGESISQTAAQAGRLRLWMTTEPSLPREPEEATTRFHMQMRSSNVAAVLQALEGFSKGRGNDPADIWAIGEVAGTVRGALAGELAAQFLEALAASHDGSVFFTNRLALNTNSSRLVERIKAQLDPAHVFGNAP